jgi:putative membrane protein
MGHDGFGSFRVFSHFGTALRDCSAPAAVVIVFCAAGRGCVGGCQQTGRPDPFVLFPRLRTGNALGGRHQSKACFAGCAESPRVNRQNPRTPFTGTGVASLPFGVRRPAQESAAAGHLPDQEPFMICKLKLLGVAALFAAVIGARADDKKAADDAKPLDDATFVKKAGIGGLHEVELSKVAAARAKNDDVKKFGERMVKDHSKANDELKAAATAAGLEVPTKLDDKHQKHLDMFKDYKGDNFDAEYVKHMIKDHEEDVALFTRASKELKNSELKAFATKTLPVVKEHLEMVKKLDK